MKRYQDTQVENILNGLTEGYFTAFSYSDKSEFNGHEDVYEVTVHVFQCQPDEKNIEVETHEIELTHEQLCYYLNGDTE